MNDEIVANLENEQVIELPSLNSSPDFFTEVSSLQHHGKNFKIRGTKDGIVVRVDGQAEWRDIIYEMRDFFSASKGFLKGTSFSIEWLGKLPSKERCLELEMMLRDEYGISIGTKKSECLLKATDSLDEEMMDNQGTVAEEAALENDVLKLDGLFEEEEKQFGGQVATWSSAAEILNTLGTKQGHGISSSISGEYLDKINTNSNEVMFDDEANCKTIYGTVRSGQRIESPHTLVILGDVNPGAEVISGGDVLVLGALRGIVHAAAYDDDGEGKLIFAFKMQPMQLRIGSYISRGSADVGKIPEIAKVENKRIVVETYNSKSFRR